MKVRNASPHHVAALIASACLLGGIPFVGSTYITVMILQMLMFITLAGSWNLITGFTGYMSFGHVVYFGVGAYAAALLITGRGVSWPLASLGGGGAAVVLAMIMGAICLRLRSHYFSISTFGLNEIVRVGVLLAEPWTRGGMGISLAPATSVILPFYAMAALALAVIVLTYLIVNSRFGLVLVAIREDEDAARVYGIPTVRYKIAAFTLSAFFAGVVGGVYTYQIGYIEPSSVFFPLISFQLIIFALFGGRGTVLGPVVGTISLFLLWEFLWVRFPYIQHSLFGVLLVVVVLFMPRGLIGVLSHRGLRALELKIPLRNRLLELPATAGS
ncbi:MAG: branched-chain amino acid ABC transporter permease [Candidatus Rokubacteria bacterium]|nr:branched-chain amino acid ABC transporter permease [Candidatus Rokubacteria bacterium]